LTFSQSNETIACIVKAEQLSGEKSINNPHLFNSKKILITINAMNFHFLRQKKSSFQTLNHFYFCLPKVTRPWQMFEKKPPEFIFTKIQINHEGQKKDDDFFSFPILAFFLSLLFVNQFQIIHHLWHFHFYNICVSCVNLQRIHLEIKSQSFCYHKKIHLITWSRKSSRSSMPWRTKKNIYFFWFQ